MTQIRPRLSEDVAAAVQAYIRILGKETRIPVGRDATVNALLRRALKDSGNHRQGRWQR